MGEKPPFRDALVNRRCLVIADGFAATSGERSPPAARRPCGLTSPPAGPNELIEPIHNRMPVTLPRDVEDARLDPRVQAMGKMRELLVPYPAAAMAVYPVSDLVNSVTNDQPRVYREARGGDEQCWWRTLAPV